MPKADENQPKTSKKTKPQPTTAERLDAIGITAICERVADCVTLREIAEDAGVSKGSLIVWLDSHADQYARALAARIDVLAADILDIADTCRIGTITTEKANGDIETKTVDMVERARLQIDARKWLAGKMAPKKYGDKIEHTGPEGGPIQTEEVLSPRELARRIAFALSIGLKDAQSANPATPQQ
jgi:AcrR family transcriptional regulator